MLRYLCNDLWLNSGLRHNIFALPIENRDLIHTTFNIPTVASLILSMLLLFRLDTDRKRYLKRLDL